MTFAFNSCCSQCHENTGTDCDDGNVVAERRRYYVANGDPDCIQFNVGDLIIDGCDCGLLVRRYDLFLDEEKKTYPTVWAWKILWTDAPHLEDYSESGLRQLVSSGRFGLQKKVDISNCTCHEL